MSITRHRFLNGYVDNASLEEVREVIRSHVANRNPAYMASLNLDICVQLDKDADFPPAFARATLILMDSQPLLKIARSHGINIKEKISGSDLIAPVCNWAAEEGWSCFFLGGAPGVPDAAARNMKAKFPTLRIAGTLSPDVGFDNNPEMTASVISAVRSSAPDILFFCCGTPKSEKFIAAHLDEMDAPFTFSVGAAIDFAAGNAKRAPRWMQQSGLEWLYRFIKEPSRLFKRYFIDSWHILSILKRYGVSGVN